MAHIYRPWTPDLYVSGGAIDESQHCQQRTFAGLALPCWSDGTMPGLNFALHTYSREPGFKLAQKVAITLAHILNLMLTIVLASVTMLRLRRQSFPDSISIGQQSALSPAVKPLRSYAHEHRR
ncbi:hypothetical protein P171DRAFT_481281 [Karstenula rhodostoma CBS 690.94]|uniref:Uncharacterized protein n=1 Tax=Karstenula rhodostoma CBS 690.94 TaxID=1392251 RepID=A0A9P4PS10_9PLEO|nr:hypothetical protein P171DRAFT_481281 [Karstenula rhodostoma CBS 690.94]